MKKIIKLLLVIGVLMNLFGCNNGIKNIENIGKDGVEIKTTVETSVNKGTGFTIYDFDTTFTNNTDKELMSISYTLIFLDENNNEVKSLTFEWNGQDTPLKANDKANHHIGFQLEEKNIKKIISEVVEVKDSEEVKPIHLPQKGEYLYQAINDEHINNILNELPIYIEAWIDHGGPRETAIIEDEETIKKVINDLALITINEETDEFVTDNYNGVLFKFGDGYECGISFNNKNLEIRIYNQEHLYTLNNISAYWQDIKDLANE